MIVSDDELFKKHVVVFFSLKSNWKKVKCRICHNLNF